MIKVIKTFSLLNNTRTLFTCLFILFAGLSAGYFSGSAASMSDKQSLVQVLLNHMEQSSSSLVPVLLINILLLMMIYFSGITIYGFPFAFLLFFSKAFSTGFCALLLLSESHSIGLLKIISTFIIPNSILLLVFLSVTVLAVNSKKMSRRTSSIL